MDSASFDRIARLLGGAISRRQGLGTVLGTALGLAGAAEVGAKPTPAGKRHAKPEGPCGNKSGKDNHCTKNKDCCTGYCAKGRCRCIHRGKPCTPAQTCCGGAVCTNGVCPRKTRCVHRGQACTRKDTCCGGNACLNGICQTPVPTGKACTPAVSVCADSNASCTAYSAGTPAGDYCLLPRAKACASDGECASQRCVSGVCKPCSDPGCVTACTPAVCPTCTYTTVQDAIDAASAGGVIDIGTGTYVEDLTVSKNLTLRACPGETVTLRNATSNATAANAKRTIAVSLNASLTIIDILVDGDSDYDGGIYGGGISSDGSVKLAGASGVKNAYSADGGGGIKVAGNGLTLTVTDDTVVDGNATDSYGGGLLLDGQSDLVIAEAAKITNNQSDSYSGGVGVKNGPNVTISGAVLIDSNASTNGGAGVGIMNWDTPRPFTATISDDVVISNNTAGSDGGGIQVYTDDAPTFQEATISIRDRVAITGNGTATAGGGIFSWYMNVEISDSVTIANNTAVDQGGGIFSGTGQVGPDRVITVGGSASITGNSAAEGAGAYIKEVEIILQDSATIGSNSASGEGGGVYLKFSSPKVASATVTDAATITGNTASSGGGVYSNDASNTLTAVPGSITGNTPDNCAGLGISC